MSSAVTGFFIIPSADRQRQWSIDTWGLMTMGGFLVPLLLALTQERFEGWDSPYIRGLFAFSGVSFVAFIIIELRSQMPVVDLRLYKDFNFAMGSVVQFMVAILFMSSTFLINVFLQRVYHFTPSQVGMLMFPQGVVYGLGSFWSGRLSDYVDPRLPLVLGLVCFALVYYWLGGISAFVTSAALMSMLCLRSFSFSCTNSPNTVLSLRTLPEENVGTGMGLFSVARGIADTLGVALSAAFLEQRRATHAIRPAQQQGALELPSAWTMTELHQTFIGQGDLAGAAHVKAEARLHGMMFEEVTVLAYQDIFMLSAFIALFNILPGLMRKHTPRSREAAPEEVPMTVGKQPLHR